MVFERRVGREVSLPVREWTNPILHADLDAFYAAVETLRDPSLKGKPVIVGGTSSRGVVTSASYEARAYGIQSAMPTSRARRLCPNAIFIQPDFDAYTHKSKEVRTVFESFSPVVEPMSLDEAFIDVSMARRMWESPPKIAQALRDEVKDQTGLVVSVGVAPNKFLAKIASKRAKPDGVVVIEPNGVRAFLDPLPVWELWGVGEQTTAILKRLGLNTVGDVAAVGKATLERALGSLGGHLASLAGGQDHRPVLPDAPRKSVGAGETFERDLFGEIEVFHALLKLADRVSGRLRAAGNSGRTVTVTIRLANFATVTRSRTLDLEIDSAPGIFSVAKDLVRRFVDEDYDRKRIRMLGISMSSLREWPASEQLSFERKPRWIEADKALDRVRFRFGDDALGFASLLDSWGDL